MAGKKGEDRQKAGSADGVAGILKGLADLIEVVGKMDREGLTEINKSGQFSRGKNVKGVYGFTVRMGLGGTPQFERFGHTIEEEKLLREDIREPIVDIIPEEDHYLIIAEMPGVGETDIDIEFGEETVILKAEAVSGRKYRKEIIIDGFKKSAEFTKNYHNGILEIRLRKQ